jgi:ribosomal-protein-alanine N-acetyltransferase
MSDPRQTHHGERIYLRPMREEDCTERYLSWFRDPEVTHFLEARNLSRDDVIQHLRAGLATQSYFMYAVCTKDGDLHIGNVKIGPIRRLHGTSEYSLVIGDRAYWGNGYATEITALSMTVGFEQYGIRKFSSGPHASNLGSLLMLLKAGWQVEGVQKGQFLLDGKPTDKICCACFNPRMV